MALAGVACGGGGDEDVPNGKPPSAAQLALSKIMLGVVPDGSDSLEISALDKNAQKDTWEASAEDESLVSLSVVGDQLTITGLATGETFVNVTSGGGLERKLPVRVYDPYVLDMGDLLISYVDEFTWRWNDSGSGGDDDGGFWHPVVPEGWHALGSLGVRGYGDPNGAEWMIVVKEDGSSPALATPTDYRREYDDDDSGAPNDGSFWTPLCPAGFVALGAVAQTGWDRPSLDDVVCVRENLTVPGVAGSWIWDDSGTGAIDWVGMWRIEIPQREEWSDTRMYLDPGTFVATGSEGGICSNGGCWSAPSAYPHMNVLAVEAPMLFDTVTTWAPRLSSLEKPAALTEPFESRAMLVPFSAVLSGNELKGRTHEFVTKSPFVRLEKSTQFRRLSWLFCGGSTTCDLEYTVEKGIETTVSDTFWASVGVSLTTEVGVSLFGIGGKVSATVSTEMGYETTESRSSFIAESWSATKPCPAESACAIWTDHTSFLVRKHVPGGGFAVLTGGQMAFDGGLSILADEYP
jgi:hypothetical protein